MALTKVKNSNLEDADLVALAGNDGSALTGVVKTGDIGSTVQAYDATIMVDADIGSTVQGYDATILKDADIGTTVQGYDATILKDADIGTTVQAYDADLATVATNGIGTSANQIVQLDSTAKLPAVDGSQLTGVDSLPSQTSQSGKFLTTNGSAASWASTGGAWNLITTTTPSSSTYVTFSGLSSSYTRYVILVDGAKPTTSGGPNLVLEYYIGGWKTTGYAVSEYAKRFDVASITPWYNTGYFAHKIPDTTPISYDSGGVSAQVTITGHAGTDLFERKVEVIGVASYNSTGSSLGEPALFHSIGGWNGTGAMTAIRFRLDSGYYLQGTFKLYGIS